MIVNLDDLIQYETYEGEIDNLESTAYDVSIYDNLFLTKNAYEPGYTIKVCLHEFAFYGNVSINLDDEGHIIAIEKYAKTPMSGSFFVKKSVILAILFLSKIDSDRLPFNIREIKKLMSDQMDAYYLNKYLYSHEKVQIDQITGLLHEMRYKEQINQGKMLLEQMKSYAADNFEQTIDTQTYSFKVTLTQEKTFKGEYSILLGLRVGSDKFYVVKNINEFIDNYDVNAVVEMAKKFTYTHDREKLDDFSFKLLSLLEKAKYLRPVSDIRYMNERYLKINSVLDEFYDLIQDKQAYKYIDFEYESIPFIFSLDVDKSTYKDSDNQSQDMYVIKQIQYDEYVQTKQAFYYYQDNLLTKYTIDNIKLFNALRQTINRELPFDYIGYLEFVSTLQSSFKDSFSSVNLIDLDKEGDYRILNLAIYASLDFDDNELIIAFKDEEDHNQEIDLNTINKNALSFDMQQLMNYFMQLNVNKEVKQDKIAYNLVSKDGIAFDPLLYKMLSKVLPAFADKYPVYISKNIQDLIKTKRKSKGKLNFGVKVENNLLELDIDSNNYSQEDIKEILEAYRKRKVNFVKLKHPRDNEFPYVFLDDEVLQPLKEMAEDIDFVFEEDRLFVPLSNAFKVDRLLATSDKEYERQEQLATFMHHFETVDDKDLIIKDKYADILKDYQSFGVKWLLMLSKYGFGGILADDMGLGKTLQAIAFLESDKKEGSIDMVVTPASLLFNWENELKKFDSHLKAICIHGSFLERSVLIDQIKDYDLVITTYDYLKKDIDLYEGFFFEHIIIDEAQYIKNKKTQAAVSVKKLKGRSKVALSGTPVENTLADLWSIFDFIMPGYLHTYRRFQLEYESPIIKYSDLEKQDKLKEIVSPFILRRKKMDVLDLPSKEIINVPIAFYPEEEKLYNVRLLEASRKLKEVYEGKKPDLIQVIVLLNQLRQICCEPRLLYDIHTPSSKFNVCFELIENLIENEKKILLFSTYTSILSLIEEELLKRKISYLKLTGSNNKSERASMVDTFQKGEVDVFLISLKAGGTGLNLTKAEAVIHYDPWWNNAAMNQATDRAHRIGQENDVFVYNLIMKHSIEEKIVKLQALKQDISDTFVENNDGSIKSMDRDTIIELLNRDE